MRGFTALFDQCDPQEVLTFVNLILGKLGAAVEECGGTIDKFTGDGFLAHFGISSTADNHANQACNSVIRMRNVLIDINLERCIADQPVITTGTGIHSGLVATGRISTGKKSEYTVVGNTVNLASRIQALTKLFNVDCLVSEQTANLLSQKFELKQMPIMPLRGCSKRIATNWLMPELAQAI